MTPVRQLKPKQPTIVVIAGPNGAGKTTALPAKHASAKRLSAEQEKITQALKLASVNAKQQLSAHGLKLPTQSWTRSAVRNPVA